MSKKSLSVVIIAKNEEEMISDCIESVKFSDEVILVDNKSTDKTVEIAKKVGAKVISTNASSFSMLREIGLEKANSFYVLYLDADERISNELAQEIDDVLLNGDADAYILKRDNYYLGNNKWPNSESFARLFKRSSLKGWRGDLHETPVYKGEKKLLVAPILHYSHRDFSSMVDKTNVWSDVEANLRLNADHPKMYWWRFPRVMTQAFYDSYVVQKGYKAGRVGFLESMYQSFSIFITYAKLWELQQKRESASNDTHLKEKLLQ